MTAKFNFENRFGHNGRPNVVARAGQFGESGQHIDFGKRLRRRLKSRGGGGNHLAKLDEYVELPLRQLVLGGEDLLFVLLELRRDVTLGVFERLLANVIRRHLLAMRVRDFEVIAEHRVEADLHARDAGPLAFGGLILGHPLLAAGSQLAKLVDIGAIAVANEIAIARRERAFVDERLFQRAANIGAQIEPRFDVLQ